MKAWTIALAILIAIGAVGCSFADRYDSAREKVLGVAADKWCGLTDEEKTVLAERRDYSDEFVIYLDSRCDG